MVIYRILFMHGLFIHLADKKTNYSTMMAHYENYPGIILNTDMKLKLLIGAT